MKKGWCVGLAALLISLQGSGALAVNPDNGPGCGLGKLPWTEYKHPKNIAPPSHDGHHQRHLRQPNIWNQLWNLRLYQRR